MPKDYSFGVVPFFKEDSGEIKYLVIQQRAGHWGFPKGHKENDETDRESACRELTEETSVTDFKIVDNEKCFSVSYIAFHPELKQVDKTVCYYIAQVFDKAVTPQLSELHTLEWFSYEDALLKISHPQIKEVLKKADLEIKKLFD